VFPYPKDPIAKSVKRSTDAGVSPQIALKFFAPKLLISAGHPPRAFPAPVPKTTIDENGKLPVKK
jgi:hypothetical protein